MIIPSHDAIEHAELYSWAADAVAPAVEGMDMLVAHPDAANLI